MKSFISTICDHTFMKKPMIPRVTITRTTERTENPQIRDTVVPSKPNTSSSISSEKTTMQLSGYGGPKGQQQQQQGEQLRTTLFCPTQKVLPPFLLKGQQCNMKLKAMASAMLMRWDPRVRTTTKREPCHSNHVC